MSELKAAFAEAVAGTGSVLAVWGAKKGKRYVKFSSAAAAQVVGSCVRGSGVTRWTAHTSPVAYGSPRPKLRVSQSTYPSTISIYLSIYHLPIYLSTCLPIYLSTNAIHLPILPSIHLPGRARQGRRRLWRPADACAHMGAARAAVVTLGVAYGLSVSQPVCLCCLGSNKL